MSIHNKSKHSNCNRLLETKRPCPTEKRQQKGRYGLNRNATILLCSKFTYCFPLPLLQAACIRNTRLCAILPRKR